MNTEKKKKKENEKEITRKKREQQVECKHDRDLASITGSSTG